MFVLKNPIEKRRIGEDDETKTPRAAGELVSHDNSLRNISVAAEMFS